MTTLTESYYRGTSEQPILHRTIGDYLDEICHRYPDNEALVVRHQGVRWNYREFLREIERLATGLLALGKYRRD